MQEDEDLSLRLSAMKVHKSRLEHEKEQAARRCVHLEARFQLPACLMAELGRTLRSSLWVMPLSSVHGHVTCGQQSQGCKRLPYSCLPASTTQHWLFMLHDDASLSWSFIKPSNSVTRKWS